MRVGSDLGKRAQNSPPDGVTRVSFSPKAQYHLLSTSWDGGVRVYMVSTSGEVNLAADMKHDQPVLCGDWHSDGSSVFAGGADNQVKQWDLNTQKAQQVAEHGAPVRHCMWLPNLQGGCLVTGGWDNMLYFWDLRQPRPVHSQQLKDRVYAMSCVHPLLVVGTGDRSVYVYDLNKPQQPYTSGHSSMRHQTRCLAAFPNARGYMVGSLEGRVAVQHVEEADKSYNFTFKCHRDSSDVYQVNDIQFNPVRTSSFATVGSDGVCTFWDKDHKQRLRGLNKMYTSISCCAYSPDGNIFSYAASYDWHMGAEYASQPNNKINTIFLHQLQDNETQPSKDRKGS